MELNGHSTQNQKLCRLCVLWVCELLIFEYARKQPFNYVVSPSDVVLNAVYDHVPLAP